MLITPSCDHDDTGSVGSAGAKSRAESTQLKAGDQIQLSDEDEVYKGFHSGFTDNLTLQYTAAGSEYMIVS